MDSGKIGGDPGSVSGLHAEAEARHGHARAPEEILKITGISFGRMLAALSYLHDYDTAQVREVARNLEKRRLIQVDSHGIFTPTAEGEELIERLADAAKALEQRVPALPEF